MFVGAYWSQRKESKESATARVMAFLTALSSHGKVLSTWYDLGKSRAAALRSPIALDAASIAKRLKVNRRDDDHQPIPDLGFRFSAWNGSTTSFSAHIGCYSQRVINAVVLDVDDGELSEDQYRAILEEMVRVFDPDDAVVARDGYMRKMGVRHPWEAGRFTYHRGGTIEEHAFE